MPGIGHLCVCIITNSIIHATNVYLEFTRCLSWPSTTGIIRKAERTRGVLKRRVPIFRTAYHQNYSWNNSKF